MIRRLLWTACAVAASVVATPTAAAADALEDGAAAPPGTWTVAGGCAARTGRTLTPPAVGAVRRAWQTTLDGAIEGEPLVDEDLAVVPVRLSDAVRALVLVRVADGRVLGKKNFRTTAPLDASLWKGTVVVRSEGARIEALRISGSTLTRFWTVETTGPAHSLVVHGHEVYVRAGDGVERWDVGVPRRRWRVDGGFRGALALRGESVVAVQYRGSDAMVGALARADGSRVWAIEVGHHEGIVPSPNAPISVHVFDEYVLARFSNPIPTAAGPPANAAAVRRKGRSVEFAGLWEAQSDPVAWGAGWAAVLHIEPDGEKLVYQVAGVQGVYTLASQKSRREWLAAGRFGSAAGGAVYLGVNAVDAATDEILWTTTQPTVMRPIPVRNGMLVAPAPNQLVGMFDRAAARVPPWVSAEAPAKAPASGTVAPASRIALRDGSALRGAFWIDAGAKAAVAGEGKARVSVPLDDLLAFCDASGRLVAAAPEAEGVRGLVILEEQDEAQQFAKLAVEAAQAKDADLVGKLLAETWRRGGEGPDVQRAQTALKDMLKRPKPPEPNPTLAAAVHTKALEVERSAAPWMYARLESLPADAPERLRVELLRAVLRLDPAHAGAIARVRAIVPEALEPPEPFAALEWLEFAIAAREGKVEVLPPPRRDDPEITNAQRLYGSMLHTWRSDLAALQSERLLVVSPLVRPGSIAQCISMGELICTTLEGIFAGGQRRRATSFPMLVVLHETWEEYAAAAAKSGVGVSEGSVGYYLPSEEMSRMNLPSDDAEFQRVRATFAYVVTHQWMEERCPLFGTSDYSNPSKPGCWVSAGLGTMMQRLRYDLRERRAELDPRAPYLQSIAAAPDRVLLSWPRLFGMSSAQFEKLSDKAVLDYPDPSHLSAQRSASVRWFFYEQSAAAWAYLVYGEEGRLRDRFAEYVGAYYRGDPPPFKDAFGMTEAELGQRVVEFARASIAR